MKDKLQNIGLMILGVLIALGGFQVIIYGKLKVASASNSVHQFNNIERLMGLMPIIFGGVVVFVSYMNLKKK